MVPSRFFESEVPSVFAVVSTSLSFAFKISASEAICVKFPEDPFANSAFILACLSCMVFTVFSKDDKTSADPSCPAY